MSDIKDAQLNAPNSGNINNSENSLLQHLLDENRRLQAEAKADREAKLNADEQARKDREAKLKSDEEARKDREAKLKSDEKARKAIEDRKVGVVRTIFKSFLSTT